MDMTTDPDAQLVRRAKAGDRDAVEALFRRHWRDAWRLSRSIGGSDEAADDATQEAFVRAISGLKRFRGEAAFRTWLHRIVLRQTQDGLRREARSFAVADVGRFSEEAQAPPQGLDPALTMMSELAPEQRAVLVLRHCLDYSLAETAELLGLPVGTVQSRAARGLSELRLRWGVGDGH